MMVKWLLTKKNWDKPKQDGVRCNFFSNHNFSFSFQRGYSGVLYRDSRLRRYVQFLKCTEPLLLPRFIFNFYLFMGLEAFNKVNVTLFQLSLELD